MIVVKAITPESSVFKVQESVVGWNQGNPSIIEASLPANSLAGCLKEN
jgi:hypothetical protein